MSVLSFPRLYFQGYMQWDVCTSNNNDYVPVYDAANAELDWAFLGQLTPPITPENFRDSFRPWAIQPYDDSCPKSTEGDSDSCGTNQFSHMPSRWNFYGGQGCSFIQHPANNALSQASGGDVAYNQPAAQNDPILRKPVAISGNTIGGRSSPARLIDINPASPFCSQIYLSSFKVGDAQTYLGGAVSQRMYSRSFFVPRNISSELIIAGAIGAIFQTTIPKAAMQSGGSSKLVEDLVAAAQNAAGLMLRFATYNTVYYKNGIFNDIAERPRNCEQLTALYQQGKVFVNPAYSRVVGVLGIWNEGELATAPGGHMLVPNMALAPISTASAATVRAAVPIGAVGHTALQFEPGADLSATTSTLPPLAPGVIHAEINAAAGIVSLDLQNAIPEFTLDADLQSERYDYGPIDVGVRLPNDTFNLIGSFGYGQYNKAAYSAKGGLVDVPFEPGLEPERIEQWLRTDNGVLALRAQGQILSLETPLTIETDDRGVYIDQGKNQRITLQVRYKNALPPPGTEVYVFQYFPWLLKLGSGSWSAFGATPPPTSEDPGVQVCNVLPASPFLDVPQFWLQVNAQGNASFNIISRAPGFPILAFYPKPAPQASVNFGFSPPPAVSIGTAFYSVARVLPFNDDLMSQFVNCWNGTGSYSGQPKYDRLQAWRFIYGKILYVYDMIFPVMDLFMPLGDLPRVEGAIDQLMVMITEDMEVSSTLYMPVTRDLSAGKRKVLETWGSLVVRKYPQTPI
jgi:hypothetical protein